MLELPEISVLADQLQHAVAGKTIEQVTLLSTPHKFAFLNHASEDYHRLLVKRTLTKVESRGNYLLLHLDRGPSLSSAIWAVNSSFTPPVKNFLLNTSCFWLLMTHPVSPSPFRCGAPSSFWRIKQRQPIPVFPV